MRSRSAAVGALIMLTASLLLSACGQAGETGAVPVTAGQTGAGEPAPQSTARSAPTLSIPPKASPKSLLQREADKRLTTEKDKLKKKSHFRLPNLVGRNLQAAQDLLQSKGSFLFHEVDATGQGREQVLDRDWKVCSQKPAAGTTVSVVRIITVRAVKVSESCP